MHAWAALLTGTGVDHEVRGADQTVLHRGGRLDRQQCLHPWGVQTAAKLRQHFREHNLRLGTIHVDLADPAGRHPRQVGPHPATDRLLGAGQLMGEECPRSSHPCRDGRTSTGRGLRPPLGEPAVSGRDQCPPGHVSAHGRRGCVSGTTSATCRRGPRPVSPCWRSRQSGMVGSPDQGGREPQQTTIRSPEPSPLGGKKLVTTRHYQGL